MKQNKLFALALMFLCILALSGCASNGAMTGNSNWPGTSGEDDIIYIADGSYIEAVQDGKKLWSYPNETNSRLSMYAAPTVDDSHIFVGTYANQLYILNKDDGSMAATVEVGNNRNKIIASPLVVDGKVYVASSGGMLSSYTVNLSGENLTPNWQTNFSGELWIQPVYYDGTLYVISMDKKMNLVNAETGELKESFDIGAVLDNPVVEDGKIYFSTFHKEVDVMDLATNEIRTLMTAESEIWARPLLMGDKLIAADMNGIVYCVDKESGASLWKTQKLTAEKTGFIAAPVALDEETILLIDENGEIMTYDLEGKSISQRSLGQPVFTTPILLPNGSFVVAPMTGDGQMKAFTADLKEDWVYMRSTADSTAAAATAEPTVEPTAEPTAAETK